MSAHHSPGRSRAMVSTYLAARLLLGGVLVVVGAIKALDSQATLVAVDAYQLLPAALVTPVAAALPWVELTLGAALLAGYAVRVAAAATGALLVGFLVALIQAKARGLAIDCGCFGAGGPGAGVRWWDIARDLPLLAGAVWLSRYPYGPLPLSVDAALARDGHTPMRTRQAVIPLGILTAAVAAAVLLRPPGMTAKAEPSPPGTVTVFGGVGGQPTAGQALATGAAVPAFTAPALAGGQVRWRDVSGFPTVLAVWASWCPHCQRELPLLTKIAPDYPRVRVVTVVTAVGLRPGPSPQQFVEQASLRFPVAVDDADATLARALGVQGLPTLYLVGPDGRIAGAAQGEVGEDALRAAFQALARR
jgi:thiol-disulfide isomerase/thioredoxin/uncharacterized membrane protein YphA (DoxX/SURF4 family)